MEVPNSELDKLEEARIALYEVLGSNGYFNTGDEALDTRRLIEITNITSQIWKVANKISWEE